MSLQSSPDIPMLIRSENVYAERRISPSWTIAQFKTRLEPITGIPSSSQKLCLQGHTAGNPDSAETTLQSEDDEKTQLSGFGLRPYGEIHVIDTRPPSARANFTDVTAVPKYVMPEEEYAARMDSVLAWKKAQQLGRFDPNAPAAEAQRIEALQREIEDKGIKPNARCQLLPPSDARRGTVRYVGPVPQIPSNSSTNTDTGGTANADARSGPWVGIELDEPTGKNDGSISSSSGSSSKESGKHGQQQSARYFTCKPKHGVFVRPERVEIGDFEVLDELGEEMEEI